MITLKEAKALLGDEEMTDRQAADIRAACYALAEMALDEFRAKRRSKIGTGSSADIESDQSKIGTVITRT